MSPLKLICKECGKTMFQMTGAEMMSEIIPIPDIIYEKLGRPARHLDDRFAGPPKCPHCNREINSEDLDNYVLKITGKKADSAFFSKHTKMKVVTFKAGRKPKRKVLPFNYRRYGYERLVVENFKKKRRKQT